MVKDTEAFLAKHSTRLSLNRSAVTGATLVRGKMMATKYCKMNLAQLAMVATSDIVLESVFSLRSIGVHPPEIPLIPELPFSIEEPLIIEQSLSINEPLFIERPLVVEMVHRSKIKVQLLTTSGICCEINHYDLEIRPEDPIDPFIPRLHSSYRCFLIPPTLQDERLLSIAMRGPWDMTPVGLPELLQFSLRKPLTNWIRRRGLNYKILVYFQIEFSFLFDTPEYHLSASRVEVGFYDESLLLLEEEIRVSLYRISTEWLKEPGSDGMLVEGSYDLSIPSDAPLNQYQFSPYDITAIFQAVQDTREVEPI
jgi:hypothetical protein